jgi:hypothetical protein
MTSIKNLQLFLFKNICKVFDQLKASCGGKKRQKAFQVETGLPTSHSQNLGKQSFKEIEFSRLYS